VALSVRSARSPRFSRQYPAAAIIAALSVQRAGDGTNSSTNYVTVTVADPASVYAGTKTVCVSTRGDYSGCPSGAAQQTAMPSGTAWNGKRVLLHKGESFGDISILDGNAGVQVASYGTGNKPVVASVGVGNWRPNTANFASDITVMDMNVSNGMSQSLGNRVLFYRNDVHVAANSGGIPISTGNEDYWYRGDSYRVVAQSAFYNAREIFIVRYDNQSRPVVIQSIEQTDYLRARARVELSCRLVREENRWSICQRTGNCNTLLLATGQF